MDTRPAAASTGADAGVAIAELIAPPQWRRVELLSDIHLHEGDAATLAVWQRYLAQTQADAVFILGDLFEVWVGDDDADAPGFAHDALAVLQGTAQQRAVFVMHGNRDFLLGERFAAHTGVQLLQDPTVLDFAGRRCLLSHGDALCLDDADYQRFRAEVRTPAWQHAFLAKPLAERRAIARNLREQSQAHQRTVVTHADADATLSVHWLDAARADTLIHGHTHRPADHALPGGRQRSVLSDWDARATPPRAEVLRMDAHGAHRVALA